MDDNQEITKNIDNVVDSVNLVTRTSSKTGKPYTLLQVMLTNGLSIEFFAERAEYKVIDLLLTAPAK
jgi:hypothetical protein